MPARKTDRGLIYFLRFGKSGPVRIGFTKTTLRQRLRELQAGSPIPLRLLGTMNGTMGEEIELHRRFEPLRVLHSWYHSDPELLSRIAYFVTRDGREGCRGEDQERSPRVFQ